MRDQKLENLITNHTMIMTGVVDESFSFIADKLSEASGKGEADPAGGRPGVISPEVIAQIGQVFSEIREDTASQLPKNASVFAQYISSQAFDRGIEIVERYDFRRPRLTERLSDLVLASYVVLLQSGDKELGNMFKELEDWQRGLPKPPWAHRGLDSPLK